MTNNAQTRKVQKGQEPTKRNTHAKCFNECKSECANSVNSGVSIRSAMKPVETDNLTPKKRRRETGDSVGSTPLDSVNTLKKEKKKPKTMENNPVNMVHENKETNETSLSDKMQQLERRITDSITNHNRELMKSIIQEIMKEMLKPIQDSIDNLLVLKTNMET